MSQRVTPANEANEIAIRQIQRLCRRLPGAGPVPLFVFDAGYDPVALSLGLAATRAAILVRLRSDRCFYCRPGQPARHRPAALPWGEVRLCRPGDVAPAERRVPTRRTAATAPCASAPGLGSTRSSSCTRRGAPARPARSCAGRWCWSRSAGCPGQRACPSSCGGGGPDRARLIWMCCGAPTCHRFDVEHTLRFAKQTLLWTMPRVRHPAQADRRVPFGPWLVLVAYTLLRLAKTARPRPAASLGTAPPTAAPDALPRAPGGFGTPARPGHARQPAKTLWPLAGPPQRPSLRAGTTPSSHQEGRLTVPSRRILHRAPHPSSRGSRRG